MVAPRPAKRFNFFGANAKCYNSREPEVLLAGPAGTGKSVVLLTKCLTLLDKYPRCRGLFCRGTRSSLTQSGLVTWEDHVLGPDHPVLVKNRIKRRVRQSYEFDNGSEFIVAGLDDPGKTLSTEYDFVYIQEATEEGIDQDKFMIMKRSLRNPAMPWHQIMMDCNPTTPLSWLFQRSRETGPLKRYNSTHKENPRFFDRTRGEWTPAGIDYIQGTLEGYTGHLRKRFLEGIWAAAEGVVFDAFDPEIHLLPVGFKIPVSWTRVWSIDWGFTSPLVLQFWAVDGDGRMYLYREQYRTGVTAIEMGEWAALEVAEGREPSPRAIVCDHDLLMKEQFEKGFPHCRLELADKVDLLAGIQVVQRRFIVPKGDSRPRIMFARGAVVKPDQKLTNAGHPASTVDELTAYIWDKNSVKDRPLDKDNHGCFVAGTLIETSIGRVPIERIQPGMMVLTRVGFRPVLACGMTDGAALVMTVEFDNGTAITGTPDHPVWIDRLGFSRLDAMRYGDTALSLTEEVAWKSSSCQVPNGSSECGSRGSSTADTHSRISPRIETTFAPGARTCTRGGPTCTATSGPRFTDRSQTVTTWITSTGTRSTTRSATCSCSPKQSTMPSMPPSRASGAANGGRTCPMSSAPHYSQRRRSGTAQRKGWHGTLKTANGLPLEWRRLIAFVNSAEQLTVSGRSTRPAPGSARTTADLPHAAHQVLMTRSERASAALRSSLIATPRFATVRSSVRAARPRVAPVSTAEQSSLRRPLLGGATAASRVLTLHAHRHRVPVFNLTVADQPEYFANGILVHNCDATRYACRWVDSHSLSTANPYSTDYDAQTAPELPDDTFS